MMRSLARPQMKSLAVGLIAEIARLQPAAAEGLLGRLGVAEVARR
jgi:hypothetical protein